VTLAARVAASSGDTGGRDKLLKVMTYIPLIVSIPGFRIEPSSEQRKGSYGSGQPYLVSRQESVGAFAAAKNSGFFLG
jgi:hypothetical protein